MSPGEPIFQTIPPNTEIVPVPARRALQNFDGRAQLVVSANRELTFGFLLGYLSLALHATLEYTRFAGYYVGPWEEEARALESEGARAWRRQVSRRSAYTVETVVGDVVAVISDGDQEPLATFESLGVPNPDVEPTRRLAVRIRRPRLDLVVAPAPGFAFDLHGFAHEVGERFRRNLD
ncbi:MAG: hypothetical protein L3J95_01145 [Thermoplasmata archaeon]|nr:hypothetical protein [Thermoplasmata archaeon]MCI4359022.1 hypothetical protein [Thermoplasmata archaeon]